MFERVNEQDIERFIKSFNKRNFRRKASNDDLHYILSIMADYDREKLDRYLFNSASEDIESSGMKVSDNVASLRLLMRWRFFEVGTCLYQFYKENPYRAHLDVVENKNKHEEIDFDDNSYESYLEHYAMIPLINTKSAFVPVIVR